MKTFRLTYDRHVGLYNERVRDFPEGYRNSDSAYSWKNDPDWSVKLKPQRLRARWWLLGGVVLYLLIQRRVKNVERYDRLKRKEQRAMQN